MSSSLPHDHQHGSRDPEALRERLNRTEDFAAVSEVFKQIGDPVRLRIFWLLCHCEECVLDISKLMEMSGPAVSHHLKLLKSSGLIVSRREGKEVLYRAASGPMAQLLHTITEMVMDIQCPGD